MRWSIPPRKAWPASITLILACLSSLALLGSAFTRGTVGSQTTANLTDDKLPHVDAVRRFGTVRFRTGDGILSLAISSDGKIIASGGRNDPVRLWHADSGLPLPQLNEQWVWALAFSPDGQFLATAGANKIIRLWEVESGKEVRQFTGHQATIKSLAFAADGAALVSSGDDSEVRVWNVANGSELAAYRGHTHGVNAVAVSPDSKHLASAGADHTVRVWDYAAQPVVINTIAAVTALAYLPDRKTLIGACGDGLIRIWDIRTAKQLREWKGHDGAISSMALSQDGRTAVTSGTDKAIRIWDVAAAAEIRQIARNAGDGDALALSRDGQFVACGGLNNTIRSWNTKNGAPHAQVSGTDGPVTSFALSPGGKLAAAAFATNQIGLIDLTTNKEIGRLDCGSSDADVFLAFSPDGNTLASASLPDTLLLWDTSARKQLKRLAISDRDEVRCLTFSPDGQRLTVGYVHGGVRLWDPQNAKVIKQLPMPLAASALAYSRDGKQLAFASQDAITIHESESYQVVRHFTKLSDTAACLAFSPDGRWLAAGMLTGAISLFDMTGPKDRSETEPRTLAGHRGIVNSLAWSSNGRCLVSGGYDKSVRLWEFVNGLPIATWLGHIGEVTSVAFLPSNRTVISASRDTTLLFWDAAGLGLSGKTPATKHLEPAAFDALWSKLISSNNLEGNDALWALVAAKDNADYLSKKVFKEDPRKIRQLVADLNSATFKTRETAFATLASYDRWVEGILKETLKHPASEEVRQRATLLLQRLAGKDSPSLTNERLRARRVIEILEQTNTTSARELLRELAEGSAEEDLRDMAQSALDRLKKSDSPR